MVTAPNAAPVRRTESDGRAVGEPRPGRLARALGGLLEASIVGSLSRVGVVYLPWTRPRGECPEEGRQLWNWCATRTGLGSDR